MEYTVYIISSAMKALRKFRKADQQKLLMAIRALADEPTPPRSKKLSGMKNKSKTQNHGTWRVVIRSSLRHTSETKAGISSWSSTDFLPCENNAHNHNQRF